MLTDELRQDTGGSRRVLVTGGSGFIGTHLVELLLRAGDLVLNLDVAPPRLAEHAQLHMRADVTNMSAVSHAMATFEPDAVVHLAARTDTSSDALDDYAVNVEGTRNVMAVSTQHPCVQRIIVVSTQFVVRPGVMPRQSRHYDPHTAYGESKAIAEEMLWDEFGAAPWIIVRPTNVWGPWHPRYPREFWRVVRRGLYVHPRGPGVTRSYGYVSTVADQLLSLVDLGPSAPDHGVFYLGDEPLDLRDWVDAFSIELTGRRARTVPISLLRPIARAGDLAARLGAPAFLTTARLASMTEDYIVPMQPTFDLLGVPRRHWRDGVKETAEWLKSTR